jgi:cobaltochelatase CobN
MLCALTRLPNLAVPSLPASVAAALGVDWEALQDDKGRRLENVPVALEMSSPQLLHTRSDAIDHINQLARQLVARCWPGQLAAARHHCHRTAAGR